jgi:hypothetical protein
MVEGERTAFQRQQPGAVINLMTLEPGMTVRVRGGATGEVISNPRDGSWVFVRFLSSPENPSLEGTEDLVFADDVLEVL